MARLFLNFSSGEVSIAGSTTVTMAQFKAPANHRLAVSKLSVFGADAANSSNKPLKCRKTYSTANFGTLTAVTPQPINQRNTETPLGTYGKNASIEPTSPTDLLDYREVPAPSNIMDYTRADVPDEVSGGQALNIEITNPNAGAVTCVVTALVEE